MGHFLAGQEVFAIDFLGRGSHHRSDYRLADDLPNGRFRGVRLDVTKLNEMTFGVEEHMALFATLGNSHTCRARAVQPFDPDQFALVFVSYEKHYKKLHVAAVERALASFIPLRERIPAGRPETLPPVPFQSEGYPGR